MQESLDDKLLFSRGSKDLWRGKQLVKDHTAKEWQGWGCPVGLWAARADYVPTPSLLPWETVLAEDVLWAGSLSELFTHTGQLD